MWNSCCVGHPFCMCVLFGLVVDLLIIGNWVDITYYTRSRRFSCVTGQFACWCWLRDVRVGGAMQGSLGRCFFSVRLIKMSQNRLAAPLLPSPPPRAFAAALNCAAGRACRWLASSPQVTFDPRPRLTVANWWPDCAGSGENRNPCRWCCRSTKLHTLPGIHRVTMKSRMIGNWWSHLNCV